MIKIPNDLVDQIIRGNCIVFVGAGLSLGANLPTWPTLLQKMLDWGEKHNIEISDRNEIETYIQKGELLLVADELRDRLGKDNFRRFMTEIFLNLNLKPTDTQMLLTKIPFNAMLTSNYDTLLETAYTLSNKTIPHVFTHSDLPELSTALRGNEFYVFKVHGTIDRIDTIVLGRSDFREIIHLNPGYRKYLLTMFSVKTVLFLGFGLNDPDLLLILDELRATFEEYTVKHYAVMNIGDVTEIKKKRFEIDYGIQIIPYLPSTPEHPEVNEFIRNLDVSIKSIRRSISNKNDRKLEFNIDFFDLLNNASDFIYILDPAGNFKFVNQACADLLGYDKKEILRSNIVRILTEEGVEVESEIRKILRDDKNNSNIKPILEIIRKDGSTIYLEINYQSIFIEDNFIGTQGIGRDVSKRLNAEKNSLIFMKAINLSRDGILLLGEDNKIIFINEAGTSLFGYKNRELLGQPGYLFFAEEDRPNLDENIIPALKKYGYWNGLILGRKKDFKYVTIEITISAVMDINGKPKLTIAVFREIK